MHDIIIDELPPDTAARVLSRISRELGGLTLYVPMRAAIHAIDPNDTAKEIAARHDVCLKTAYRWRAQAHRTKTKTFSG